MDKQTAAGLLPCPFCGGKDIELGFDYAACRKCRAEIVGAWNGNENAAKKAWNRRAASEPERRGHWKGLTTPRWTGKYNDNGDPEYIDYIYYTCSICYRKSVVRESYCPKCGAKMYGETDKNT